MTYENISDIFENLGGSNWVKSACLCPMQTQRLIAELLLSICSRNHLYTVEISCLWHARCCNGSCVNDIDIQIKCSPLHATSSLASYYAGQWAGAMCLKGDILTALLFRFVWWEIYVLRTAFFNTAVDWFSSFQYCGFFNFLLIFLLLLIC
jgi:hypothetical protein